MQDLAEEFRGRKLLELLPRLEDKTYQLVEVSPPNQQAGRGAARILDIREKDEILQVYFCLEDYV